MAITQERLGFFNARLEQRMIEMGLSAPELARRVGVTYEHVRKLIMGQCLPSDSTLERLCTSLGLKQKELRRRVMKDKMIFRFGDAAWQAAGIDPRVAPCYILFPLLTRDERELFLVQVKAVAETSRTRADGVSRSRLKSSQ
ncbi:MAG: helix-turn-helix domain-containing protein [Acidobacteriia bacterium]|nr:helix-turn-helix domain-containing protein [Terriglobia bacterium]